MDLPEPGLDSRLAGLGIALALGLLIGLEREWGDKPIGLRSFALISLFGGLTALFIENVGGWPIAAGLLAIGILLTSAFRDSSTRGITTLVAALVAFLLGAAAVAGYWLHATVLAGAVTLLLHWKEPMHGVIERLDKDDLKTISRFVLITLVVLPILPDKSFGPYEVFNPFNTWLMVALIVSINLAGYIAFRFVGTNAGAWLAGIIGGLVSSTATTFSYSNISRQGEKLGPVAALVILIASAIVYPRIAVEVSVVAPGLLQDIIWPSVAFGSVLVALSLVLYFLPQTRFPSDIPEQSNPAQVKTALTFAAIYVVVLFAVAAARDLIGRDAVFAVAFASGLTDVDALTLSVGRLFDNGNVQADTAWRAIFLASLSNLLFKIGVACVVGSASLRRWILLTGVPALLAGTAILVFWP